MAGDCRHRHLIAFRDDQQKSLASLRDRSDECDRHGKPWEREQLHEGVYDRRAEQHHGVRHPRGSHRHDYHPFDSFSSLKDLGELAAGWPAERLAAIWNSLPGAKPVKSFKTAKVAASRIWSSIQGLGEDAKPEAKPPKPKPDKKAKGGARAAKGAPAKAKASKMATPAKKAPKGKKAAKTDESAGPRENSKGALVVDMLRRKNGATLAEIMASTGWLSHTTGVFVSATLGKKLGLAVESFKPEGVERTYRINP